MMAGVFEEENEQVREHHIDRLLNREEFWAIAAFIGHEVIGGLPAHTLPMTRAEAAEVLVYDIAVRARSSAERCRTAVVDNLT